MTEFLPRVYGQTHKGNSIILNCRGSFCLAKGKPQAEGLYSTLIYRSTLNDILILIIFAYKS